MQNFKEGDEIEFIMDCTCGARFGEKKTVMKDISGYLYVTGGYKFCGEHENWKLVTSKERTLDELEVGDELEREDYSDYLVEGVLGKIVFVSYFTETAKRKLVTFYDIETLKKENWKIKQPKKKEEEKINPAQAICYYFSEKRGLKFIMQDYEFVSKFFDQKT